MPKDVLYTADQLEAGIGNALAAQDVEAAVAILRVLVTVDAHRAELVMKTMEIGLEIAAASHLVGEETRDE